MTSNFLLLNSDKTEILLIGPKNSTQNLLDYNLQLDGCTVTSSTVKNLGVILESNLSFENHISHVTKTAFFHLRNIANLRNMLSVSDAEKLVHAFMTSRLDYCNALLGACPASSEIIIICWFAAQDTFMIIINVENSCAAQYFCGNTFYVSGFIWNTNLFWHYKSLYGHFS